jgi:uncharacterized protein (DUF885 family)
VTKSFLHLSAAMAAILSATALAAPARGEAPAAQAQANSADARLRALYESDWQWRMDDSFRVKKEGQWVAGAHLPHVDAATQQKRLSHFEQMLAELNKIPIDQLSHEERINAAVFRTNLENDISDLRFREYEMPFDSDSSFWTYLNPRQGYRTAEEYRRYISRMREIPRYFDEQIVNMRAGLKRGFSVPRSTLEGRDGSIVPFANIDVAENPFYEAFEDMPASIPEAEQAKLKAEGQAVIREVVAPA